MRLAPFAIAAGLAGAALPAGAADWPVFGHDPARSGVDASPRLLTARNVAHLRARWQISLGAVADSSPILLEGVKTGGVSRALLFQTASDGTTFAIDAGSGRIQWRFAARAAPAGNFSLSTFLRTAVFGPNVTNSTPAADPSRRAIYVPGLDGFVRKLDAAGGAELRGGGFPARLTLVPRTEKDAAALNVANGYLYATTSGYNGDARPYDGRVVSVRLSDGKTAIFNSLCSDDRSLAATTTCPRGRSGIWSRGGAVVDPDPAMQGRVYVATGNGAFDANAGGHDYGDSVLALRAGLSGLIGHYTPMSFQALEDGDADLGSTSPALLPRQRSSRTPLMLVQGGKDRVLRLLDRAPLPGVGGELQTLQLAGPLFSTPAVWTDPALRVWIFVGLAHEVDAFRLTRGAGGASRLVRVWRAPAGDTASQGTSPVVSNGIVFDAFDGAIVALDAGSGRELWSSARPAAGRTIGPVHWQSPIVANGWVYCSDQNGNLTAYALS
jgi:outer membrane protein assembly factor BamB